MAPILDATDFADLVVPLVTNVDADVIDRGSAARAALIRQVASPVRWSDSVRRLIDEGVGRFIEIGPGKVLSGLVRQISREVTVINVEDPDSLDAAARALEL